MSDKRAILLLVMASLVVVGLRAWRERLDRAALAAAALAECVAPVAVAAPDTAAPAPPIVEIAGVIRSGDILASALRRHGLSANLSDRIIGSLRKIFDPRRARPGDIFRIALDTEMSLLGFEYDRATGESFRVEPLGQDLAAFILPDRLVRHVVRREGTLRRSLYEAVREAGGSAEEVGQFADIFAGSFDFFTECQPGDGFSYVVEAYYDGDRFKKLGRVLFGEYAPAGVGGRAGRTVAGVYYQPEGAKKGGYYTLDGESLQRAFLRSPLAYRRITSRFTMSRFHPILKHTRPHLGVDYAAPTGTPVSAVADGIVARAGWLGGLGRCVEIRHAGGISTAYGHLSRIGLAVGPGRRISQGDVIGYVGSTGLATGPHLHFNVERNGVPVDPLRFESLGGAPLDAAELPRFARARDALHELLVALPVGVPTVEPPAATTAASAVRDAPPRS